MSANGMQKTLPSWALPLAIALGVLLLVFVGWKALSGTGGDSGPAKEVRPGMYDLRKEAQSGNLGRDRRRSGSTNP